MAAESGLEQDKLIGYNNNTRLRQSYNYSILTQSEMGHLPYQNGTPPVSEMEYLFAAGSLATNIGASNNDGSVALFAVDCDAHNKIDTFGCRTERAFHLYVPKQSELGHFHHERDRRIWRLQFVRYLRLYLTASSSVPALSHVLLSAEKSLDAGTMILAYSSNQNGPPLVSEMGHSFAAGPRSASIGAITFKQGLKCSNRVINQNWDTWVSANIRATNFND